MSNKKNYLKLLWGCI